MPGRNGTGPRGTGSMTGRGIGNCTDGNQENKCFGRGRGNGMGRFGFRNQSFNTEESAKLNSSIAEVINYIKKLLNS